MDAWDLLWEVVVLLTACLVAGGLFSALRQSPLVGYLLAGMLLGGPGSLQVVRAQSHIEAIAELGVALLLFSLGLEFSWRRLLGLGTKILGAGAVQVVLTGAVGTACGLLFRLDVRAAVAVGAMVALSSTAAVLRILIDRGEIDDLHGRNALAILLVQDMAVVPLAVLVTLLAGGGTPADVALDVLKIIALAAALVVGFYVAVNKGAVWLLRRLSGEKTRELTVLLAVVVGLGAAWAAHAAKLSPALGAFLAGMFLGSSPFATQVRADVSSLRVVLLTLFFGSVGMVADPLWIAGHLPLVLGISVLLVVSKALLVWGILRLAGQATGVAAATGLCLAQIGEFAFVLGHAARSTGVIGSEVYAVVVSTAIVTLFATPYLVGSAPHAAAALQRWRDRRKGRDGAVAPSEVTRRTAPDVAIIGFGPAGRAVGNAVAGPNVNVVVVDVNPSARTAAESVGFAAEIGDATSLEVLRHARVHEARVVAITIPARSAALTVLDGVRQLNPAAWVVVRSRYALHEPEFAGAGANAVVGDEAEVGERLAELVRFRLVMPGDATGRSLDEGGA